MTSVNLQYPAPVAQVVAANIVAGEPEEAAPAADLAAQTSLRPE
jgi:hypothetical protein